MWQFNMFHDYLVQGVKPEPSGLRNLPTIEICDAAQRPSELGKVIRLVLFEGKIR